MNNLTSAVITALLSFFKANKFFYGYYNKNFKVGSVFRLAESI